MRKWFSIFIPTLLLLYLLPIFSPEIELVQYKKAHASGVPSFVMNSSIPSGSWGDSGMNCTAGAMCGSVTSPFRSNYRMIIFGTVDGFSLGNNYYFHGNFSAQLFNEKGGGGGYADVIDILGSNDGVNWSIIYSTSGYYQAGTYSTTITGMYRYLGYAGEAYYWNNGGYSNPNYWSVTSVSSDLYILGADQNTAQSAASNASAANSAAQAAQTAANSAATAAQTAASNASTAATNAQTAANNTSYNGYSAATWASMAKTSADTATGYLTNGTYGLSQIKAQVDNAYNTAVLANSNASNAYTQSSQANTNAANAANNTTYSGYSVGYWANQANSNAATASSNAANANTNASNAYSQASQANSYLTNGTYGLSAIIGNVGTANGYLTNSTYGLSAINNNVGTASSNAANANTNAYNAYNQASQANNYLSNGTYGLNAINSNVNNAISSVNTLQNAIPYLEAPNLKKVSGYNNATATSTTSFNVSISYSGANEYQYKVDNGSWSAWTSLSSYSSLGYFTVTIPSTPGQHTIYVSIRNNNGAGVISPVTTDQMTMFKL